MNIQALNGTKMQLSELAYSTIKEGIISGKFKSGEVLPEVRIAQSLSISRTPLREALNKLHAEGLVDIIPNKGCVIKKLELRDILEITLVREALEGMVARLACEKVSKEEVNEIISWFPPFDKKLEETDYLKACEAGVKLHQFLRGKANNRLLEQQVAFLDMQIKITTKMAAEIPGRYQEAFNEHKAIVEALLMKDPELAEKKMREHITKIRISLLFEII